MILGFVLNTTAGQGLMGELKMTIAGDVDRSENASYIFQDANNRFGKIVEISYNYE